MTETVRLALADDPSSSEDDALQTSGRTEVSDKIAEPNCATDAVLIVQFLSPDLILLNTNMCGGGILAVETIAQANPDINVLMLTVSDTADDISAECGEFGYALTPIGQSDRVETMRSIPGVAFHDASVDSGMLHKHKRAAPSSDEIAERGLTVRENQIMSHVAKGLTNGEIAAKLDIKEKTVKSYMTTILDKLCVRNRVEAVLKYHDRQW